MRKTLIIMAVMVFAVMSVAVAGDKAKKAETKSFEGKIVCVGCDLKKADGARAACKEFGCSHALKTKDGSFVNLLENKYSKDLLTNKQYAGKDVKVTGVFYAKANQLDVQSFSTDGKTKSWCDHCKAMDGCKAKKAGH